MSDCIFCKIVANEIPATKVYEDKDFVAFLDIQPVSHGHTLVIPKEHYDRFELTPPEVVSKLYELIHRLVKGIVEGAHAQGYNLGLNSGQAAGQVIWHTHVHIIPRSLKDGLSLWPARDYEGNTMEEVAQKIRAAIKQTVGSNE